MADKKEQSDHRSMATKMGVGADTASHALPSPSAAVPATATPSVAGPVPDPVPDAAPSIAPTTVPASVAGAPFPVNRNTVRTVFPVTHQTQPPPDSPSLGFLTSPLSAPIRAPNANASVFIAPPAAPRPPVPVDPTPTVGPPTPNRTEMTQGTTPSPHSPFHSDVGPEIQLERTGSDRSNRFAPMTTRLENALVGVPTNVVGPNIVHDIPEENETLSHTGGRPIDLYLLSFVLFSVLVMGSVYVGVFFHQSALGTLTRTQAQHVSAACVEHEAWEDSGTVQRRECQVVNASHETDYKYGYRIKSPKPTHTPKKYKDRFGIKIRCYEEQRIPCINLHYGIPRVSNLCWEEPMPMPLPHHDKNYTIRHIQKPYIVYEDVPVIHYLDKSPIPEGSCYCNDTTCKAGVQAKKRP